MESDKTQAQDVPLLTDEDGNEIEVPVYKFDFQEHDWHQEANELICPGTNCSMSPYSHGTRINPILMLTGIRGKWELIDEANWPTQEQ